MDESVAAAATAVFRQNSTATSVLVPKKLALLVTLSFQAPPNQDQNDITNSTTNTKPTKSPLNLKVLTLKSSSSSSSYISLKDVLPFTTADAINSPTGASSAGYQISIRNRLVKQAAWAYLRPMSALPITSSGPHFLHRLWHRISSVTGRHPLTACLSFVYDHLVPGFTRILHRMFHAIRIHVTT